MARPRVKKIDQDIKATRRRYPGAQAKWDDGWYIEWNGENVFNMFLLDNTNTIEEAWLQARDVAKYEQHINRTHPLKQLGNYNEEFNKIRVTKRIHYAR